MIETGNSLSDIGRFKEITRKMTDIYAKKNHDYGNSFQKMFLKHGMRYSLIHLEEKLNRIEVLSKDECMVDGEGVEDSLIDLANYAILTLIEFKRGKDE